VRELEARPERGLALRCEPREAEVYVDGTLRGTAGDYDGTPRSLNLPDGEHVVELKAPGYWPYRTRVSLSGAQESLEIRLVKR
jgi:hypothetical protein